MFYDTCLKLLSLPKKKNQTGITERSWGALLVSPAWLSLTSSPGFHWQASGKCLSQGYFTAIIYKSLTVSISKIPAILINLKAGSTTNPQKTMIPDLGLGTCTAPSSSSDLFPGAGMNPSPPSHPS